MRGDLDARDLVYLPVRVRSLLSIQGSLNYASAQTVMDSPKSSLGLQRFQVHNLYPAGLSRLPVEKSETSANSDSLSEFEQGKAV